MDTRARLSPSALSNHLGCAHATTLDRGLRAALHAAPTGFDPARDLRVARGRRHESRYVDMLRAEGLGIEDLAGARDPDATRDAMARGVDVIVQAPLGADDEVGEWHGQADVLRKVALAPGTPAPPWGPWSYEVHDTKLSHETRAGTLLQLAMYSDWLVALQGTRPQRFHVVMPGEPLRIETFRLTDVDAYARWARGRFAATWTRPVDAEALAHAPDPRPHCDVCRWWRDCDARRRADDQLSLVAGIARSQMLELRSAGITTLAELATVPDRIPRRPSRGTHDSLLRMHHQARVQLESRESGSIVHELLDSPDEAGLGELPPPCPGDLFLDFEGAPHVEPTGVEYLFGVAWVDDDGNDQYEHRWAFDAAGEHAAFAWLLGEIGRRRAADPGMHVYHFGAYEGTALRRLGARFGGHMDDVDRLLRGHVLVDLHAIVRRSVRVGVESYSIKQLEPLYGLVRAAELPEVRVALRDVEAALELGDDPLTIEADALALVMRYNRDDCVSVRALRDWLEVLRLGREQDLGRVLPRPPQPDDAATAKIAERNTAIAALAARLQGGVPADPLLRTPRQSAHWLLADILSYHRREDAATWWDYFHLAALDEDDAIDHHDAIVGLQPDGHRQGGRSSILRYRFPPQDLTFKVGDDVHVQNPRGAETVARPVATVFALDRVAGWIELRAGPSRWSPEQAHPTMAFRHRHYSNDGKIAALQRLATWMLDGPGTDEARWDAADALLMREAPRLRGGALREGDEDTVTQARRLVTELDRTVLAIQGPPGTGKTHTGAEMILQACARGLRVGVTAGSHAAVRNLLDTVVELAEPRGAVPRLGHRTGGEDTPHIACLDNERAARALEAGELDVLGATTFFWVRPDLPALDVLFVDEAGQLSLADTLAVCGAATNVVLLGDPQQLQQPCKASHPDGAAVSALRHLLGDAHTIARDRGIFLGTTWRLPPELCAFTSRHFYDGRLVGLPELERRALLGETRFAGRGLFRVAVPHEGCDVRSPPEVDAIDAIVAELLATGEAAVRWCDKDGIIAPLRADDILVVAPYNAQVDDLALRLAARGVHKVGTVDRFQGQQAPVVIWSMTSSTADDAPRGLGFLYDGFRLNVATSRAKVCCIVVGSPSIFDVDCHTAADVQLLNPWCALAESAPLVP